MYLKKNPKNALHVDNDYSTHLPMNMILLEEKWELLLLMFIFV